MKPHTHLLLSPKPQGCKGERTSRPTSLVRAQSRALKTVRSGFAPLRLWGKLLPLTLALSAVVLAGTSGAMAQAPEDTLRIRTRVVFLDALVKDKRTSIPIS